MFFFPSYCQWRNMTWNLHVTMYSCLANVKCVSFGAIYYKLKAIFVYCSEWKCGIIRSCIRYTGFRSGAAARPFIRGFLCCRQAFWSLPGAAAGAVCCHPGGPGCRGDQLCNLLQGAGDQLQGERNESGIGWLLCVTGVSQCIWVMASDWL